MVIALRHSIQTAPPPAVSTWPKASDTGPPSGTVFTNSTNAVITGSNITITNTRFIGTCELRGSNVTFRNCRFEQFYPMGLSQQDTAPYNSVNVTVDHCHFDGGNVEGIIAMGVLGLVTGTNIEGVTLGISCYGPLTVRDCYIHDLDNASTNPDKRHFDGIVSFGGGGHVIDHNAIVMLPADGGTAAISMNPTFGSINNVWIKNNLCMGRAAYTIATEEATAVIVEDNHLDLGIFGWVAAEVPITERRNVQFNAGPAQQTPGYVNPIPTTVPLPPEVQAWLAKT